MVAGTEFELDARASQAIKSVRTRTVAEIESKRKVPSFILADSFIKKSLFIYLYRYKYI